MHQTKVLKLFRHRRLSTCVSPQPSYHDSHPCVHRTVDCTSQVTEKFEYACASFRSACSLPRPFFCVCVVWAPHGGSCGSRPGFLLPSSPASPRSSWASLLLKGLSRRALDLEAGLAENGGAGGVLGHHNGRARP